MKLNEKNFNNYLNTNFIFEKRPSVAVAVSGGPDSMLLSYLLNKWIKQYKGKIIALLINHGIRKESSEECNTTKKNLKKINIQSKIINVKKSKITKLNMNEARINRYNSMTEYCKRKNILHLFIAHHFDDNLETFLIRKIASSNLEGLASIQPMTINNKIQVIRPLLSYRKADIIKFNLIKKINFLNDPSNSDIKFTRVVVRNFLKKTNKEKKISNDLNYFSLKSLQLKKIAWCLLIKLIDELSKNKIKLNLKKFLKIEELMKEKLIEYIYYYIINEKKYLRSSKIILLLSKIKSSNFLSYNLGGLIVEKQGNFLEFYKKK